MADRDEEKPRAERRGASRAVIGGVIALVVLCSIAAAVVSFSNDGDKPAVHIQSVALGETTSPIPLMTTTSPLPQPAATEPPTTEPPPVQPAPRVNSEPEVTPPETTQAAHSPYVPPTPLAPPSTGPGGPYWPAEPCPQPGSTEPGWQHLVCGADGHWHQP